jgi:hypothetical protein
MGWRLHPDDRAAWSAAGGIVTTAGTAGAIGWLALSHEPSWPALVLAGIAGLGLYGVFAPLLGWGPWHRATKPTQPLGNITAGRGIKAGVYIEASGNISAGDGIEAGRSIRAGARPYATGPENHKHDTRRAHELLRLIFEAERKTPTETVYFNLAAMVEAWAKGIGSTEEVQRASGNPVVDLPRLMTFVQVALEQIRENNDVP